VPLPSAFDNSDILILFAGFECSRSICNAIAVTVPPFQVTFSRLTGDLGIPTVVELYVPALFQPHAVQVSENSPPCIDRTAPVDEHLGHLIKTSILFFC
jgi:hypothetical protein